MILTDHQTQIREMARNFARDQLAPHAAEWDRTHRFPIDALRQMGALGFMGMLVPEEYGGADTGMVAYALTLQEIAAGDAACSTIMSVHNSVACLPILRFGTDAQRRDFLPNLASGAWIGGFALTEPQAGSDAANLRTRAHRVGHDYILTGTKQFITSGKNGQVVIAFAVTDPGAGRHGISAFIVPTDTPGYEVIRVEEKLGQRASDTCQIAFNEMRLSSALRLGAEGDGYRIALANLEGGRIGIAAQSIGMARAAFEAARNYARDRSSFGKPIMKHQAVGFRLADMATQIEAAHRLLMHAAALRDAGQSCATESSMAKLFATEMVERVCSDAIQIFGGYGYLVDFPVERIYRDARVCQIYEGTSDVQRMVIAKNITSASPYLVTG